MIAVLIALGTSESDLERERPADDHVTPVPIPASFGTTGTTDPQIRITLCEVLLDQGRRSSSINWLPDVFN